MPIMYAAVDSKKVSSTLLFQKWYWMLRYLKKYWFSDLQWHNANAVKIRNNENTVVFPLQVVLHYVVWLNVTI